MGYTYDDSLISDLYKDAYGMRPTPTYWTLWRAMPPNQKQGEWEYLCKLVAEADEARRIAEEEAFQHWISNIQAMMTELNLSKAEAIRMDMAAADCVNDTGFYCYTRRLSYSLGTEIDNLLKGN